MKSIEAIPLTIIIGIQIASFIPNYIICRYVIPYSIVTKNGIPFKNQDVQEICERFHIQHQFSTPYYAQGNGQVEVSNKTILEILNKNFSDVGCDWNIQLNPSLWAYQTNICTPT